MRKLLILCVTFFVWCLIVNSVSALSLRMTLNGKDPSSTFYCCVGSKIKVRIYLDGWDTSQFKNEQLLGVQMFLHYDKYHSKINLENTYPANGFDPSLSFAQILNGKTKLVAANSECMAMSGSVLLWTVEVEIICKVHESISAQINWPDGVIVPGGVFCTVPHQADASKGTKHLYAEYEDLNGNGCVDYCECEADFDNDGSVNSADVTTFLNDFGRGFYYNPCTDQNPCHGDFDCDSAVAANDTSTFLADFGRSLYNDPCPQGCYTNPWCDY